MPINVMLIKETFPLKKIKSLGLKKQKCHELNYVFQFLDVRDLMSYIKK